MLRLRGDHMALLGLVEPAYALQEREERGVTAGGGGSGEGGDEEEEVMIKMN